MFLVETKWRFDAKSAVFDCRNSFHTHTFQVAFSDFRQESSFLTLLMVEKGQGFFFISEKRQGAFLTSKKGQGAILTFKRRQGAFLTFKKRAGCGALRKTQNMNTTHSWYIFLISTCYWNKLMFILTNHTKLLRAKHSLSKKKVWCYKAMIFKLLHSFYRGPWARGPNPEIP